MTMHAIADLLVNHGLVALFVIVLAEQAGLPAPGAPMLLAAGSLASLGRMNTAGSIVVALAACLTADLFWYEAGRRGGSRLKIKRARGLRRSEARIRFVLARSKHHWIGVLLLSKYLPGPNLASPMAGISGLNRSLFLIFDMVASTIWTCGYIAVGFAFGKELPSLRESNSNLPLILLLVVTCIFITVAAVRSMHRRWPQLRHWKQVTDAPRRLAHLELKPHVSSAADGAVDARKCTPAIAGVAAEQDG